MSIRDSADIANCVGEVLLTRYDALDVGSSACRLFGADAALAVAFIAIDARLDGRGGDFKFWTSVFRTLTDE